MQPASPAGLRLWEEQVLPEALRCWHPLPSSMAATVLLLCCSSASFVSSHHVAAPLPCVWCVCVLCRLGPRSTGCACARCTADTMIRAGPPALRSPRMASYWPVDPPGHLAPATSRWGVGRAYKAYGRRWVQAGRYLLCVPHQSRSCRQCSCSGDRNSEICCSTDPTRPL